MKNTEGSGVAKGASSPRRDIITFTLLHRREHAIAHVRTLVVVEVDNAAYDVVGILQILRPFHAIQPFLLYNAVDTFGYSIVCRLVVLRH